MPIIDVILLGLAPATAPAITYMTTGGLDIGVVADVWTPVSSASGSWSAVSAATGTWTPVTPASSTWTPV